MIIRVTLKNGNVMMFGDSYKPWEQEFQEYCWAGARPFNNFYLKDLKIEKVEYSNEKFPYYGGLKWGSEQVMVERLKEQAAYEGKTPKDYSKYVYEPATKEMLDKIGECLKDGWRLAYSYGIDRVMPNA